MNQSFTIRAAKNHDVKKIFSFLCTLEEQIFDQQQFMVNYRTSIAGINTIYLVAVNEQNDPVGFISCHGQLLLHHAGMVYEIQELFVEKDQRGKGVGKLLVKAIEEQLTKREYVLLEVATQKWRTDTRRFYNALGYAQTHVKFSKTPAPKEE